MNTTKKTVALIFGGRGHEHAVSLMGGKYVLTLIDRDLYGVLPVLITQDGVWRVENATLRATYSSFDELIDRLENAHTSTAVAPIYTGSHSGFITEDGELIPVNVALPLLHGDGGEDGTVQGALECARIAYVGCDVTTSAISLDKAYAKILAERRGIPTARWMLADCASPHDDPSTVADTAERELGYPMFVKAARLGSSVGVYRVETREELIRAHRAAARLGSCRVLIEEAIDVASELECAVMLTERRRIFSDLSEIRCDGGYYTYERKYSGDGATVSPSARVSKTTSDKVKKYTRALADALGTRHLSRFDFFLTTDGQVIFNEVNTLPGFTPTSMYARLIEGAGVSPRELISELLEDALHTP